MTLQLTIIHDYLYKGNVGEPGSKGYRGSQGESVSNNVLYLLHNLCKLNKNGNSRDFIDLAVMVDHAHGIPHT